MRNLTGVLALSLAAVAAPLAGEGIASLEISGSTVSASIELPGGVGADLTLAFEEALGLGVDSLGLSADLTSASALLGRLPSGASLPTAFPVVVRVEPPQSGPLSFSGIASLELHTHNLAFTAGTPLRLFRAQSGGPFVDITESMGMGSYRVRGSTGGFSEFIIVADTRSADAVIESKYDALQATLESDSSLDSALVAALQGHIDASYSAYAAGSYVAAAQEIESFADLVSDESGTAIPNVWRSARDLFNTAGELRAAASTLRLSLNLRASSGPL